jgi:hypothetical protein
VNATASAPIAVRSMTGTRQVPLALRCLGSLKKFAPPPGGFVLHDDGSLTAEDRARLAEALAPCVFPERAEVDAQVADRLRGKPHCEAFRRDNKFGTKLFDIPIFAGLARVVYCDTDIVFTRPVSCPGYFAGGMFPFVCMRDLAEQYAVKISRWREFSGHGVRLTSRVCAGMIAFDPAVYDLDYLEWLLALEDRRRFLASYPNWAEQTLYAALAARAGAGWIAPAECVLAHPRHPPVAPLPAIIHFAGFHRALLETAWPLIDWNDARPPLVLETVPAPRCTLPRRLFSAVKKRLYL